VTHRWYNFERSETWSPRPEARCAAIARISHLALKAQYVVTRYRPAIAPSERRKQNDGARSSRYVTREAIESNLPSVSGESS